MRNGERDMDGTVARSVVHAGFRLTQAVYRDVPALPNHSHPLARICLTMEGSFRETIDGITCECRPGTVLLRPPGAPHDDLIGGPLRNILIEVEPRRFEEIRGAFDRGFAPTLFHGAAVADVPSRIDKELWSNDSPASVSLESLLLRLVADISRALEPRRSIPISSFAGEAAALIDRSFPTPVGVSALARRLGVSVSTLAHEFRRQERCSIGEYVRRRRLEFARRLLRETAIPISSVALEAGFCDQAHLTREFKKAFGIPPAAFRQGRSGPVLPPP
ncbi:MAG TPA: AraC family transcriptional regulator [Thermoanaerobaculia bacterium]|nr:AraC family transcriptional regulator [Thermoanaerobaculia bacterium]